jgi:hypothetical protein
VLGSYLKHDRGNRNQSITVLGSCFKKDEERALSLSTQSSVAGTGSFQLGICTFFFHEAQTGNIPRFSGHPVLVPITSSQLFHCSTKEAKDKLETNECGCVPIKLYQWRAEYSGAH